MIIPTKYENIKENPLIIGYHIIALLKENPLSFLEIHHQLFQFKKIELGYENLLETLTFLYLSEIIEIDNNIIRLKNDSQ